ncbi:MAG TPA: TolC family protein [Candidatus Elarobacter sp.]|nr:TolC family protein [Candidatus Elarobacter sp.]
MMTVAIRRGLALAALTALAASTQPALAQTPTTPTTPAAPKATTVPAAPRATTAPAAAKTPAPAASGVPQTPSALPGAAGTPPPGAPGAVGTAAPAGGNALTNPNAIPTLAPADQAAPLPFPAYGTPAPMSTPLRAAGVPQVVTLQQSILIAYARSPLLASARADVGIATAPVGLAKSALLPSVTAVASSSRGYQQPSNTSRNSITFTDPITGAVTTINNSSQQQAAYTTSNGLTVALQQLIFDGGRVAAQIRSARATQSASIATYQRELQTVAFNVATAYYNTLAAERQTQVALTTVQLDLVQEALVSAQIRAGTEARADLSTAQLPTAQARVAVVKAQANQYVQLATFANALGIDAGVNVQPKDDIPALSATSGTVTVNPSFPTPTYQQAMIRASAFRPDLSSEQFAVISNQENLRAARLGTFPTLTGSADYGPSSTDSGGGTFRNSGSIGVKLTIPVYDQGVTRAQTAQAQAELDKANAQYVIALQGIQLNVQQSLVNLVAAYAALDQTNAELAKAQDVLRSTEAQFRAGVTTLPLLLNAQVGITQALTDEVTAVYSVRQAEQTLLFAEGVNAAG